MRQTIDCIQGTDEWLSHRLGRVTSSKFSQVLNKKTGRGLYMRKVAAEWIAEEPEDGFSNGFMEAGLEKESLAREVYEEITGCSVEQTGLIILDDWISCSPDGLVGDDGLLEIKCPIGSTQIQYLETGKLPAVYVPQVQGQLWVTDRKWCDFMSFHPAFKPLILRVERDDKYIENLETEVYRFVEELKAMITKIKGD